LRHVDIADAPPLKDIVVFVSAESARLVIASDSEAIPTKANAPPAGHPMMQLAFWSVFTNELSPRRPKSGSLRVARDDGAARFSSRSWG
jgi:hypothetical protein